MVLLSTRMGRYRACALGAVAALTHWQAVAQQAPAPADLPPSTISAPDSAIKRNAQGVSNQPLTIERAVTLAAARSRALVSQAESARAARESAIAAGQRPDPIGRVAIENLPVDGSAAWSLSRDFMTMRSIGINQELTRSATLDARRGRFERAAEVAEASGDLQLAELASAAARAWLQRHFRQRLVDLLAERRTEAALQVEAADAGYRGATGRQADAFAARAAVAALDERIIAAQSQLETARIALARWIGSAEAASLGDPPMISSSRIATLVARQPAVDHPALDHPALPVLERRIAAARADAELARAERNPDWRIGLSYSQRGSAFSNMASINLSLPLQWDRANRQDRKLVAALATVDAREAERDEAARQYDAQTRSWLQGWRSGLERISRYDGQLLPLASERGTAALVDYRAGTGSLDAALAARRGELDLRIQRLELEADTADLWARLEYLMPPEALARPASMGQVDKGDSR